MFDITVTWLDGMQETYTCGHYVSEDGELRMWEVKSKIPLSLKDYPTWNIPRDNMRIYKIEPANG